MNNNGIDDTTEEKHIIVIKDGDTILSEQELIPWIAIVLPTAPTKAWYTFDGRDWLPTDGKSIDENLTITAKWKKNETTPTDTTPRAWGGSWGGISITTNTSNTNEHSSAELTGSAEQKSSEDTNKENNSTTEKEATAIDSSFESEEVTDAYKWAYANDITTLLPIESNPDGKLLRWHLAKMLVNYSVNVLWKEVPTISEECKNWNDDASEWESEEIKSYAEQACALWLMWVDTYQHKFRPNQEVSRAQFGTTLSRLLYGEKYDGWFPYYEKHLKALNANNIMKNTDNPQQRIELRKWVWVMLQRIQEEKK